MSTENDFQTLTQTDGLNPVVSKQGSLEKETKPKIKPVLNLKQWIATYRSTTRVKIGRKLLNFSTVLACLPVAVGFLDFLRPQISSPRHYESFFQKTLPVFANFQPKLTYETFHYITKANSVLIANQKGFLLGQPQFIATLNQSSSLQNDSNLKTFTTHSQKSNFTPNFLNLGMKKQFNLNLFSGFSCYFSPISSGSFTPVSKKLIFDSVNILPQILDELPSYVQGLPSNVSKPVTSSPDSSLIVNEKKSLQTQLSSSRKSKKQSNNSISIPQYFLLEPSSQSTLRLLQQTRLYSLSNTPCLTKGFWSKHRDFYTNVNQLDREFQKLFLEKKISLSSNDLGSFPQNLVLGINDVFRNEQVENENQKDLPFVKELLQKNSHIDDEFLIDMLLRTLDKQKVANEADGFRLMSGYNYPDTTQLELSRFYKQKQVFQFLFGKTSAFANFFNLSSPFQRLNDYPNFTNLVMTNSGFGTNISCEKQKAKKIALETTQYDFKIQNLPSFSVQTQDTLVKSHDNVETLYQGPSLVLDSENGLDWVTRGNLRSWFHHYLSPLNPFSQNSENFFGLYESPFNLKQKSANASFRDRSLFYPSFINQIKRSALVVTPLHTNFLPSRSSFFIAADSDSTQNHFVRGIDTNVDDTKQENASSTSEFVPLIQTRQPYFKVSSAKASDFQGYSPIFEIGITGKSDYIYSLDLVTETEATRHYSSGQYKKIPSIFSTSSLKRGVTNWEPLTTNSWLVVTQLSFAIFIFQILKNLAENYGRELLGYLLDLVAALGFLDESLKQEIELLMGRRDKGFRIISQSSKTFTDIVGVQKFLPELYEVIWYLRNSARDFALSGVLPRGVLLTGPPGTGKTLLVQALAGEAHVPVIVLSGSSLIEPGEIASTKLELVFQEARQIAPCIVFIDEIDTLAPKRSGVVQNPMAHDEIVDLLTSFEPFSPDSTLERLEAEVQKAEAESQGKISHQDTGQQLSLLTQLLIELDGIRGREGVLVIGATNRLDILDAALLRPGRFDQIIEVGLPNKQKRVNILQFYADKLGYQEGIPWNYLGERTVGFSAADLATLMNESALKAILTERETVHTLETIEHGIDRLTTSENEKPTFLKIGLNGNLSITSKLSLLRFAYYQAGKIVVSSVLKEHPKSVFAALWPRCPNIRSLEITTNLQTTVFEFARLSEITDRLIGCYAGKAAEFLFLEKFASHRSSQRSTLGLEDLLFGQTLAYSLLEKFLFYSKKSYSQQTISIPENINELEFPGMLEKLAFYEELVDIIESPPFEKALEEDTSSLTENLTIYDDWEPQSNYFVPWWQRETSDALEFVEKNFHNWTRFYLENPERSERNVEWRPPDEFYHTDTALKDVKKAFANVARNKRKRAASSPKQDFGEASAVEKEQAPTEIVSQTELIEESAISEPSITRAPDSLKTNKTEVSPSLTFFFMRLALFFNFPKIFDLQTGSLGWKSCVPWRDQDKTEMPYPVQNVYIPWDDVSNLTRDYPVHSLILQSFNKALVILNQNRELVDRFVIYLLCQEILRQHEIEAVLQEFQKSPISEYGEEPCDPLEKQKGFEIIEADWGQYSRKPRPRWIDFAQFSKKTT